MEIIISKNHVELGKSAGIAAVDLIQKTIAQNGTASIILATGASQFGTLDQLILAKDIDWSKVVMFHLDEYIGLPESSPSSFRKYLKERFLERVSPLQAINFINANPDPVLECKRLSDIIKNTIIDVALVGIGENGHLAFNDPPANFETDEPFIIVNLDNPCRKQQYNEGWFNSIEDVPKQAISMSIKQIFNSKHIICSVPEARKAKAVRDCLEYPVNNLFPASILQLHQNCTFFLDTSSASLLSAHRATI